MVCSRKHVHHQQISGLWLRAPRECKSCPGQGRIPIRPVLPGEPNSFAFCNVRCNQLVQGISIKFGKFCVRAQDQNRAGGTAGDEGQDCSPGKPDRNFFRPPEADKNYRGYAGKQILRRKITIVPRLVAGPRWLLAPTWVSRQSAAPPILTIPKSSRHGKRMLKMTLICCIITIAEARDSCA